MVDPSAPPALHTVGVVVENVTGNDADDVALTVNGDCASVRPEIAPKVIVCAVAASAGAVMPTAAINTAMKETTATRARQRRPRVSDMVVTRLEPRVDSPIKPLF